MSSKFYCRYINDINIKVSKWEYSYKLSNSIKYLEREIIAIYPSIASVPDNSNK